MARSQSPNSANSQFFICFNDTGCASLRGQYTVVGQVTSGMEAIDKVKRGEIRNVRQYEAAGPSGIDRDLKLEAARNVASRLAERFPASEWDWLKSSLYAAGAKLIADAFVNETGAGVSTMDKAGWA
jgi:hypothetical protein